MILGGINGFNSCFENSPMTKNELLTLYASNSYGYCYHSLVFDKSKIIAFNTYTPHKYKYGNEFILLVLSGSTYVLKGYRKDIFILKEICNKRECLYF